MSAEAVIGILGAIGVFLGVLVAAYRGLRGDKFQRGITESAALLTGYTEMVSNLRKEIDAMRVANANESERQTRQHAVEIANLRDLHLEERSRWNEERDRLEERIDTLEAQVAAVLYRPKESHDRHDDA